MKNLLLIILLSLTIISTNTQAADEGIKVHGHWKLKIYNPDGSFDKKVEFENALGSIGAARMLRILNKEASISRWSIQLDSSVGAFSDPCRNISGDPIGCLIVEPSSTLSSPSTFKNLTYNLDDNTNPTKFILSGSIVAAQSLPATANIGFVATATSLCEATLTPNCSNPMSALGAVATFTSTLLSSPVNIASGQIVQVTVEISFS